MKLSKALFEETEFPIYIGTGTTIFQSCCDCKLRHVWYFKVHRGKVPEEDFIELNCTRDSTGTKLREFYENKMKSKKKKR